MEKQVERSKAQFKSVFNILFYYIRKPIFLFFSALFLSFFIWKNHEHHTPIDIPITFSKNKFPIVKVDIEGKQYPLEFSLSFKYPLYISEENLNGIKKSRKGLAQWKNIKGEQQQAPLFEIKKIQLGALKLKNILTTSKEKNVESG